ncbi:MAG: biopolymer transporter ExbD [Elusimicrobia bacterium]|nr:biopolymer transporter ExbD [Elusimicrobiota bacterium]
MKGSTRFQLEDDAVTGINVTPLVDVCLVLVIIFMVATPLLSRPAFDVSLPVAKTKEGEEQDKVTLSLSADGRLAVDSMEFKTPEELQAGLKRAIAGTESGLVVIRADREALHGRLTDLMARAKAAGARSLTVATEQRR